MFLFFFSSRHFFAAAPLAPPDLDPALRLRHVRPASGSRPSPVAPASLADAAPPPSSEAPHDAPPSDPPNPPA
jgi:hypothetical protein